ncbi:hypothetical protein ACIQXF_07475 [Lysinibacillus sp. NPDC097231]
MDLFAIVAFSFAAVAFAIAASTESKIKKILEKHIRELERNK